MVARIDIPEDVLYQKYIVEELSTYQIAKEFGCSQAGICKVLKRYNIPARPNHLLKQITISKDILYQKYVIEKSTGPEIAKELGHSESSIYKHLKYYNIDTRNGGPIPVDIDKQLLYNKYIIEKLTMRQISDLLNVSQPTIKKCLEQYNIPIRSIAEVKYEMSPYKIKKWDLYYFYYINEIPPSEIGKMYKCATQTIYNYLYKYNIPIRSYTDCRIGSKNGNWCGGISTGKYCYKFNNKFKEYIREKFDRTCYICGKTENELDRKLAVHHIDYNKSSICNGKEFAFVPLCHSCHAKTNKNRWYWFNLLINYWLDKYEIYDIMI